MSREATLAAPSEALAVVRRPGGASAGWVTRLVGEPLLSWRGGRWWWMAFAASFAGTVVMIVSIGWLFYRGVGIWGLNSSNVWGYAIANYVWWIGIGNAGTLISCLLLLTRQRWRASINRFAEAMTLFSAAIAGLFPILHLGRPWLFYWLMPYPNVMGVWPQWRSPLVWDLFAVVCYLLFSILFWYTGLIPDLATLRDRARTRFGQRAYGLFALGWRGSAAHWRRYESFYGAMAALGVPLVVSVHSVVGLDFAVGISPGWNETIFPPYFVVGALFSGFAMVVTLAVVIRPLLHLEQLITLRHFDAMAKILLAASLVMGASYLTEWFMAWYSGDKAERTLVAYQLTGASAPYYWLMLTCNVLVVQLLWWPRIRRSPWLLLPIALAINLGMWLERVIIVTDSLSRGFLPSQWREYWPSFWDWALFLGTISFFCWLFLCLLRFVPAVSMHETKKELPAAAGGEP